MAIIDTEIDTRGVEALRADRVSRAATKAARKASSTSLRDMRSEAKKRVRARKKLKAKTINRVLDLRRAKQKTIDGMTWGLDIRGKRVGAIEYPHRKTKKGVVVEVNKGKRTLIKSAFLATMKSGHEGIWIRQGSARLPIAEVLASRPVDALLHAGEAEGVAERGRASFSATFDRLLPIEMEKEKKAK